MNRLFKIILRPSAIGLLLAISSCDRAPPVAATPRATTVFATIYPLADIARQVGGERVRADWLLDLGDSVERYPLDRRDRERMVGDLILCDGAGRTEIWAQRELDRFRETGSLVSVDQTPDAWQAPGDGLLVLDPKLAGEYAKVIALAMARRLPAEGDALRQRAQDFAAKIDAAVAKFQAKPEAQVIVLSHLFTPMLTRLGVRPTLYDADALHLTEADAGGIRRAAQAAGIRSMIVPFDTPPGTLAYLEQQTGLKPFTLDPLGYPNYAGHATYLEVLAFNLEQLRLAVSW